MRYHSYSITKEREVDNIKDTQIDLCGQIGYEVEETFPVLQTEDVFSFACNGCGGCCRGREDIVLSGYDLYRIAGYLRLPMQVVVGAVCRHYYGKNSLMPVVRLQPLENAQHNCPFLYENRCAIHEVEPLVCALYPLGQQIELDGTVAYFAQTVHCGGEVFAAKLGDFLARYEISKREALDVEWAFTCITLARTLKELAPRLTNAQLSRAQCRIYDALYIKYDIAMPYQPQFKENIAELMRYFSRVGAIAKQKRGER